MKNEPWKHAPKSSATKAKISASMRGNADAADADTLNT